MSKTKAIVKVGTYELSSPDQMIQAAKRIKEYIVKNNLSVTIAGHQYVLVEGWQFAGSLMHIYPMIVCVEDKGQNKWMVKADIIDGRTDKVVGTGYALCSKAEAKKASFDEYAILSMAQTRAIGKAFRNRIGWIIKLAGYEPTPAEEIKAKPAISKEVPNDGMDYIGKLKQQLVKMGADTEAKAIKIIKDKTGLVWKDFKTVTNKQAQIALFMILNETKK
jgi:hypothetical protein